MRFLEILAEEERRIKERRREEEERGREEEERMIVEEGRSVGEYNKGEEERGIGWEETRRRGEELEEERMRGGGGGAVLLEMQVPEIPAGGRGFPLVCVMFFRPCILYFLNYLFIENSEIDNFICYITNFSDKTNEQSPHLKFQQKFLRLNRQTEPTLDDGRRLETSLSR